MTVTSFNLVSRPSAVIPANLSTTGWLFQGGGWNAALNEPPLESGVGTDGFAYVVGVPGTTNLDGISTWNVDDWAVFVGQQWNRIRGGGPVAASETTGLAASATVDATNASNITTGTLNSARLPALPVAANVVGFRNRFVNGDFGIDQVYAGAVATFVAGANYAIAADQWAAWCAGGNVTGQKIAAGALGNVYRFTGGAGCSGIGFMQRIEAADSYDLAGQTATLSVLLSNSLLSTVTWTAYYGTTTDALGTLSAATKTQIATGSFTVSSTLANYSVPIAIPSGAITGIEIDFQVGAQTSGTWQIGTAQIELGAAATPFEKLPISVQLQRSQRYFEMGTLLATSYGNVGSWIAASVQFNTIKRIIPTMAMTNIQIQLASATPNVTPTAAGFYDYHVMSGLGSSLFQDNWTANARLF